MSNFLTIKERYQKVAGEMQKDFKYKSVMAVPKIEKVVVNVGFGKDASSKGSDEQRKFIKGIVDDLSLICGQKPSITKAKKSISGFKLREGMPVGARLTLRKKRMNDFLDRLINVYLPRTRDFKGLDISSFDKQGNFTIGIKEQIIFPEVSAEKLKNIFGLQIIIKTTAKNREEGVELLKRLGFPIKR